MRAGDRPGHLPTAAARVVRSALGVALAARAPVIVWGAPGEGKTRMVEALAEGAGRPCTTLIGSLCEPTDLGGLPMRNDDGTIVFAPPRWAADAVRSGSTVLFLDELTTCSPAVQAAMLRLVLDRKVGDLALPRGTSIVAAANPPDLAADGQPLAPALANRFCHLWYGADPFEWAEGILDGWSTLTAPAAVDPGHWAAARRRWAATMSAFVRGGGTLRRLPASADAQGGPWPSPRTWDLAHQLAAAAEASGAGDDVIDLLLRGCVGEVSARELLVFADDLDLPDPERVLDDPAVLDSLRADQLWAALSMMVQAVEAQPTEPRWHAAWSVLARLVERQKPDVGAVAARRLVSLRQPEWAVPSTVRSFLPLLRQARLVK